MWYRVSRCSLLLLFSFLQASGRNDENFAADQINPELLINANAVVRYSATEVNIRSLSDISTTHRFVVTVLNEKGDFLADFSEETSALNRIHAMEGYIFDKSGKQLQRIGKNDFLERGKIEDYTGYEDIKVLRYHNTYRSYPYTIEYRWQEDLSISFVVPGWQPVPYTGVSVAESHYKINYPADLKVNWKELNLSQPVRALAPEGKKVYEWALNDYKAIKAEPFCYGPDMGIPLLVVAAERFQLQEYTGSAASWADFGRFIYRLDSGRDALSEQASAAVTALVKDETSNIGKAKTLYRYLQQHTRYIMLLYGIGGWQSLPADYVHAKGYGDCKALSNYMKAMLRSVGVTAYPVLIQAGAEGPGLPDMGIAYPRFNHEMLCIPSGKDTVFLECTSNTLPFGYLGSFTQNRPALMITPEGGRMIRTPVYGPDINRLERKVEVRFDESFRAHGLYTNRYSGAAAQKLSDDIHELNDRQLQDYFGKKLALPSYEVKQQQVQEEVRESIPFCTENLEIEAAGMARPTGKYLSVKTNYLPLPLAELEKPEERKLKFRLAESRSYVDTIVINTGAGWEVESTPADIAFSHPFGSYESKLLKQGERLTVCRKFVLLEGSYSPDLYRDFAAMLEKVSEHTKKELLLRKL